MPCRAHRPSAIVLLGLLALGCDRPSSPESGAVAVMYFENLGDPADADHLGRMLTGLLTDELHSAEGLEVVSQQRLYDAAAGLDSDGISDPETAATVARRLGISAWLIGRVTRQEDALVASVHTVDAASGRVVAGREVRGRSHDDVFGVAETLGRQLRETLPGAPAGERPAAPPAPSLTRRLTDSVPAYRAYVEGEQRLHRKRFAEAAARFREAIAIDPEFALAHYRLSITGAWSGRDEEESLRAAQRAAELGVGLPASQRRLFEAAAWFLEGRFSEAIPRVEAILAEEPEDKEALYWLSEMYLHSGLHTNVPAAVEAMRTLDGIDPDFQLLRDHLVLALVMLGRWEEAESYLEAWSSEMPAAEIEQIRSFALALGYRADEVPPLSEPLAGTVAFSTQFRGMVTMITGRWEQARELAAIDAEEGYLRTLQLLNRGNYHVYAGEFAAALAAYRGAVGPAVPGDEGPVSGFAATVHEALAELQALGGDLKAARAASEAAVALQPRHPSHRYHAGRLALLDGDRAAAEEHLRVLRAAGSSRGILVPIYEQALAAELLLADGEAGRARAKLAEVVGSNALLHEFFAANTSAGALFRDALARACRAGWDQAGEIAALEGLVDSGFERLNHPATYVRAFQRLGELHLEAGDEDRARQYFRRFLDHWGDADWNLAEVAEARDHLAGS